MALSRNDYAKQAAAQLGYSGTFGAGGRAGLDEWKATDGNAAKWKQLTDELMNQQVAPALQEPLHQFEKGALVGLADTSGLDQGAMQEALAQMRQALGQSGASQQAMNLASSGAAPITPGEVDKFANPYQSALKNRLSETAEKMRAALNAKQGMRGGRSFGDTATGIQSGMLDQELLSKSGDIDYQVWQDALKAMQEGRGRQLAGSQSMSLAGRSRGADINDLFRVGAGLKESGIGDLQRQLGSGSYIRDYNQRINDIMQQDILAGEGDIPARIANSLNMLGQYQSGGDYFHPAKQSTFSKVGQFANMAAPFFAGG